MSFGSMLNVSWTWTQSVCISSKRTSKLTMLGQFTHLTQMADPRQLLFCKQTTLGWHAGWRHWRRMVITIFGQWRHSASPAGYLAYSIWLRIYHLQRGVAAGKDCLNQWLSLNLHWRHYLFIFKRTFFMVWVCSFIISFFFFCEWVTKGTM